MLMCHYWKNSFMNGTVERVNTLRVKIAMIGKGEFLKVVNKTIPKLQNNSQATIKTYSFNDNHYDRIISEIENDHSDIIITGRYNRLRFEKKTNIPIISLNVTPTDVLVALKKSIKYSKQIAIALSNTKDLKYDYSILQDLLDIKFFYMNYLTYAELESKINDFRHTNGAIIGTGFAVDLAQKYRLNGILIYSEYSILESIERSIEIIHFKRNEEKNKKQLKTIINSVKDGIIATDEHDRLTLINPPARRLLHLEKLNVLGKHLTMAINNNSLHVEDYFNNKIIDMGERKLNTNKNTIFQGGKKLCSVLTFQDITEIKKIEQKHRIENEAKGLVAKNHFDSIIFTSEPMKTMISKAKKFSKTNTTILITGETGTGKELLAQSIHNLSDRKPYPFVAINCAALPESLLESELFGYDDGAFTGASRKGKRGLFEIAHNGTVFLDEINSVSLHFQARLLRVLQEKEVVRIGGDKVIPVNIRIISASNMNLMQLVKDNKFRSDLYYRLNVLNVHIPPLRQRLDDIRPLTESYISQRNQVLFDKIIPFIDQICEELCRYDYPGNVRELYNILERFVILNQFSHDSSIVGYRTLLKECLLQPSSMDQFDKETIEIELGPTYKESIKKAELSMIKKYITLTNGNKSLLAEKLGMGRTTLYRKLKELDINL